MLIDLGGGMIFDDDLNITRLQDADFAKTSGADADGIMTHDDALAFAANLVFGGFDDWRLPSDADNELSHLYYFELGNGANFDPKNLGPFLNVETTGSGGNIDRYWSAEKGNSGLATIFRFANGFQGQDGETGPYHPWPVRNGIPEPSTSCWPLSVFLVWSDAGGRGAAHSCVCEKCQIIRFR